jgi:hypothetical protein
MKNLMKFLIVLGAIVATQAVATEPLTYSYQEKGRTQTIVLLSDKEWKETLPKDYGPIMTLPPIRYDKASAQDMCKYLRDGTLLPAFETVQRNCYSVVLYSGKYVAPMDAYNQEALESDFFCSYDAPFLVIPDLEGAVGLQIIATQAGFLPSLGVMNVTQESLIPLQSVKKQSPLDKFLAHFRWDSRKRLEARLISPHLTPLLLRVFQVVRNSGIEIIAADYSMVYATPVWGPYSQMKYMPFSKIGFSSIQMTQLRAHLKTMQKNTHTAQAIDSYIHALVGLEMDRKATIPGQEHDFEPNKGLLISVRTGEHFRCERLGDVVRTITSLARGCEPIGFNVITKNVVLRDSIDPRAILNAKIAKYLEYLRKKSLITTNYLVSSWTETKERYSPEGLQGKLQAKL